MKEKIESIKNDAIDLVAIANDLSTLNDLKIRFLGKSGEISGLMRFLGSVPKEEKPEIGKLINEAKVFVENAIGEKIDALAKIEKEKRLKAEEIDVTLNHGSAQVGALHPITKIRNEIAEIFLAMGFSISEGPEIETDFFNFQLLNVPKDHPARDMQDTFYISENLVLRTHTSPMQARIMQSQEPPIRVIIPGKVYRSDDDASHSPIFNQIEGLAIDKHISLGDLQGCLQAFAEKMFSKETKVRFRPSYFPFTEPSVEVDVTCTMCKGKGCRVCKGTGWVEILGAGIVNPKVLEMSGIDPNVYSGFAFGLGVERIAMIKYGIPNIKLFYENDARFLQQFN